MSSLKGSKTECNLKEAFAKESQVFSENLGFWESQRPTLVFDTHLLNP